MCFRIRSKWSKSDSFTSDYPFTVIRSANQCIYKTSTFYIHHIMHFILYNAQNVTRNNFPDLQTDRLNKFSDIRRISGQKISKSNLLMSVFLIYVSCSLIWCARLNVSTTFSVVFQLAWVFWTDQFLFQNLIKTCMFSRSLFCVDHFGASSLCFRELLHSIFIHFYPIIFFIQNNCWN